MNCTCNFSASVRQAWAAVESAGGEETNRRKWLAVKGHVHQHQLDSHHPPHGTCTYACSSDGKLLHKLNLQLQIYIYLEICSIYVEKIYVDICELFHKLTFTNINVYI